VEGLVLSILMNYLGDGSLSSKQWEGVGGWAKEISEIAKLLSVNHSSWSCVLKHVEVNIIFLSYNVSYCFIL